MDIQLKDGWIEVIAGCMFAGKTEELCRRIRRIKYAKKDVVVFKPIIDTRYSEDEIVSHDNKRIKSINAKTTKEIRDYLMTLDKLPYAVAIDEVQFFDQDIVTLAEELADSGVRVICAGLDKNFRGEPFGVMPILLSRSECVTKLDAICSVCGGRATRTQRIIDGRPAYYEDPIILVGSTESYEARCRHCHKVPHKQ